jgi:hypothetical protein
MKRLELSGAVRPIYVSLGVKRLRQLSCKHYVLVELKVFEEKRMDKE